MVDHSLDNSDLEYLIWLLHHGGGGGGPITLAGGAVGPSNNNTLQRIPIGPVRFIDPSNVTGFASDSNTGATATNIPPGSGPILTTAHLNTLLFFRSLTASTTITYLSDDLGAVLLDMASLNRGAFNLNFVGAPTVLHSGGTLNAGTIAINPATNQRQAVHTTDVANFNPFVFTGLGGAAANPCLLVDLQAPRNGTGAWIVSATGPASPSMSRPVQGAGAGALNPVDSYQIQRGCIIGLALTPDPTATGTGAITFTDFAFNVDSIGPNGAAYTRCSWLGPLASGGSNFLSCFFGQGIFEDGHAQGSITIEAGVLVVTGNDSTTATIVMSGDLYVTGQSLVLATGVYSDVFFSPGIGAGVQIQDNADASGGIQVAASVALGGLSLPTLIWGTGNAGPGIGIFPGGVATVTATLPPIVTGAGGDFAFRGENGNANVTVARAWNEAIGAYTEAGGVATRTTTWAHFAAAIGAGGFAFQAHNPATDAAIVGL